MLYKATYYNKGMPVCTTTVKAADEYEAEVAAGFKLTCKLPNVEFDRIDICKLDS